MGSLRSFVELNSLGLGISRFALDQIQMSPEETQLVISQPITLTLGPLPLPPATDPKARRIRPHFDFAQLPK